MSSRVDSLSTASDGMVKVVRRTVVVTVVIVLPPPTPTTPPHPTTTTARQCGDDTAWGWMIGEEGEASPAATHENTPRMEEGEEEDEMLTPGMTASIYHIRKLLICYHKALEWVCTFAPGVGRICGHCFNTSSELNKHSRTNHTRFIKMVGTHPKFDWYCATCKW